MQKKLIAAAVAGLLAIPAFAQSNVTISGQLNAQYGYDGAQGAFLNTSRFAVDAAAGVVNGNQINQNHHWRMTENSSELRFTMTEDLGGGLSAFGTIGTAFDPGYTNTVATSGQGVIGSRNTAVGLRHKTWGEILMGRWDVHYNSHGGVDGFFAKAGLSTSSLALLQTQGTFGAGVGGRLSNVLRWASPAWNGFNLNLAVARNSEPPFRDGNVSGTYARLDGNGGAGWAAADVNATLGTASAVVPGGTPNTGGAGSFVVAPNCGVLGGAANVGSCYSYQNKNWAWQFNPTYNNGPWHLFYSYFKENNASISRQMAMPGGGGAGSPVITDYLITLSNVKADITGHRAGIAYTFGMGLKVGLIWDRSRIDTDTNAAELDIFGNHRRTAWVLPVSYNTGAHTFGLTYAHAGNLRISNCSVAMGCVDPYRPLKAADSSTGAHYWMLGYTYDLSKRTSLSATYAKITNESNANYDFFSNGGLGMNAAMRGADPRSIQVGMRHVF